MVTLNVNGIECRYGSTKILSDINFEVKPGDFVGILGPNGSGKTTLLKSISRVLKPHGGSILIDKDDIYALKPIDVAKKMAVVPQDSTVGFNFSVMDVVLMGRNPHLGAFQMESQKDVEVARKAMELTSTWHLAGRSIHELSGGSGSG
jgi:iron complex transport system ATP-binding protein